MNANGADLRALTAAIAKANEQGAEAGDMVCARSFPSMRGHTAFLTFATKGPAHASDASDLNMGDLVDVSTKAEPDVDSQGAGGRANVKEADASASGACT